VLLALDILRQLEHWLPRVLLIVMAVGISYDNWKTLGKMRTNAKAAKDGNPSVSSWPL